MISVVKNVRTCSKRSSLITRDMRESSGCILYIHSCIPPSPTNRPRVPVSEYSAMIK